MCGLVKVVDCFQVKYSSGKNLLLDLTYLNPTDDFNRELYKETGSITKFGEQVVKVLNVEFSHSSCGKRPNTSIDEFDENQTKRPSRETKSTSSTEPRGESPEVALPIEESTPTNVSKRPSMDTSSSSTVVSTAPNSTSATPASQFSSTDGSDGITLHSSQQRYALSLCKFFVSFFTLVMEKTLTPSPWDYPKMEYT